MLKRFFSSIVFVTYYVIGVIKDQNEPDFWPQYLRKKQAFWKPVFSKMLSAIYSFYYFLNKP